MRHLCCKRGAQAGCIASLRKMCRLALDLLSGLCRMSHVGFQQVHMPIIYPDLAWYSPQSERKGLPGRCPYTSIHRCPRYFESVALLSDVKVTAPLPKEVYDTVRAKWQAHELAPATGETATSVSGGGAPNCYANFCPEVAYDTFKLFASSLIRINDSIDREIAERVIREDPTPDEKDWRWSWSSVEPLHYTDCALYAKLHQEKRMSNITFNGPVTGNINVAGHSISATVMSLSMTELIAKIEASSISAPEKEAAKSKLAEFLAHPVLAAVIGGLTGTIGS